MLEQLPQELLLFTAGHLAPKDVLNLSETNKNLFALCQVLPAYSPNTGF